MATRTWCWTIGSGGSCFSNGMSRARACAVPDAANNRATSASACRMASSSRENGGAPSVRPNDEVEGRTDCADETDWHAASTPVLGAQPLQPGGQQRLQGFDASFQ